MLRPTLVSLVARAYSFRAERIRTRANAIKLPNPAIPVLAPDSGTLFPPMISKVFTVKSISAAADPSKYRPKALMDPVGSKLPTVQVGEETAIL